MKTLKRKILSLFLALSLALSLSAPALAATPEEAQDDVELLYNLGLFLGSGTNADGTPNIAIFTPGAAGDDSHIVFGLADNATKASLLRDKVAKMVFDIPNTAAETKEERHQGAVVKLELEEDQDVLADLMASNDRITENSLVCRIVEVLPVG